MAVSSRTHRAVHAIALATATLLGLAALYWLRTHQADYADKFFPIVQAGTMQQRVQGRNFAVEVTGRRLATAIRIRPEPDVDAAFITLDGDSNGIWLPVAVKVEALQMPGQVTAQLVTRDGRVFTAAGADRPKLEGTHLAGVVLAPGLTRSGVYFFWVPKDSLEGLHAQFFWGSVDVEAWDSLVDIDLDIGDAAKLQALQADAIPAMDLFQ